MGIRTDVVDDEVENDFHVALVCLFDQFFQIGFLYRIEVDVIKIFNPIPVIPVRHILEDRRQPNRCESELFDVIGFSDDAAKCPLLERLSGLRCSPVHCCRDSRH